MPAILRLQEAATSHLYLRERVGNPIGRERSGTVLATRSALTGSNRPLPRAQTAAQEIIVGRAAAPATSGRLRRQSRKGSRPTGRGPEDPQAPPARGTGRFAKAATAASVSDTPHLA